jgi:hypothetical protein
MALGPPVRCVRSIVLFGVSGYSRLELAFMPAL